MSLARRLLDWTNAAANRAGVHIMPVSDYQRMHQVYHGPTWQPPPIDPDSLAYLTFDNPQLKELRRRYEGHPATGHTQWGEDVLARQLDLTAFRGDNHYVYQVRHSPSAETYYVTAYHVRDNDRLGLFGRLVEDGMFGAFTLPFENGYVISRDLLESINEINFLYRVSGFGAADPVRVLDIGAGYGRLAHRLTEGMPATHVTCTDAVPLSTFLCAFHLRYRGADRTDVVPLDEVESKLAGKRFDIVTNIHSFPECPQSAIGWWLRAIGKIDVARLLIIPNARDRFLSTERDGSHPDFLPLLERSGWYLAHKEPIYAASPVATMYALYPNFCFHLFERR